ncbi:MAG TPA: hypothetical protein VJ765_10615 [Chitinophagaceae bacterium]|nr:hypothetical protein [Chitinophagaceae bacterium]
MKSIIALLIVIVPLSVSAQSIAVNTDGSQPDNSAIFDIKSNSKGLLVPRLTTLQRTSIMGPALGLTVFDTDTYNYWVYRGDVNGGWVELLHNLDKHWTRVGTTIYNLNPGNIGIGTNNPTEKISINATDPAINFMNAGTEKGFLQSSGNHMRLGTYNSNATGNLFFQTMGIDRMAVTHEGNIGIGILSPVGKFQITGGVEASPTTHGFMMLGTVGSTNLVFDNNEILARNNGNSSHLYLQNSGGNVYIGDAVNFNSAHRLGVDGNTVITGNLRVGTTVTPSGYRLAVDGKVICTELMVRLVPNWPDYVFSNNYKLRSIKELENFINKNNHLPGIPSASEIESTGLSIGQMQKLQMEKIEELTLYIIELKKEIDNLKAQK